MGSKLNTTKQENKMENNTDTTFNGKEILGSTIIYGGIRYNVSLANYDCLWLARAGSNVKNGTHSTIIELLKKFKSGKVKFAEVELPEPEQDKLDVTVGPSAGKNTAHPIRYAPVAPVEGLKNEAKKVSEWAHEIISGLPSYKLVQPDELPPALKGTSVDAFDAFNSAPKEPDTFFDGKDVLGSLIIYNDVVNRVGVDIKGGAVRLHRPDNKPHMGVWANVDYLLGKFKSGKACFAVDDAVDISASINANHAFLGEEGTKEPELPPALKSTSVDAFDAFNSAPKEPEPEINTTFNDTEILGGEIKYDGTAYIVSTKVVNGFVVLTNTDANANKIRIELSFLMGQLKAGIGRFQVELMINPEYLANGEPNTFFDGRNVIGGLIKFNSYLYKVGEPDSDGKVFLAHYHGYGGFKMDLSDVLARLHTGVMYFDMEHVAAEVPEVAPVASEEVPKLVRIIHHDVLYFMPEPWVNKFNDELTKEYLHKRKLLCICHISFDLIGQKLLKYSGYNEFDSEYKMLENVLASENESFNLTRIQILEKI